MLSFNWSGLKRFHWLPAFRRNGFDEYWYWQVKWLNVQTTLYSVAMAKEVVAAINRGPV